MKKIIFIIAVFVLSSCAVLKPEKVDYILAMNTFGDKFWVSIPNLEFESRTPDSTEYSKMYFYWENEWHLGKDWFVSLDYPFRDKKAQKKFEKKYNKKLGYKRYR